MSQFTQQLQKYYKRSGNKIVFSNGMNLSQVALEMWGELGFQGIDAARLSRVLAGKSLFSKTQLDIFCTVLSLKEEERLALENTLAQTLLSKHLGQALIPEQVSELILSPSSGEAVISMLTELKNKGALTAVIELSSILEKTLTLQPLFSKQNSIVLARMLALKARCYIHMEPAYSVFKKVQEVNQVALSIAQEKKDAVALDMARGNIGGAFYVSKNHEESAAYLDATLNKVGPSAQAEFVRTLLISCASINDRTGFYTNVRRAEAMMNNPDRYNNRHLVSMVESISRALSMFGQTKQARSLLAQVPTQRLIPFYHSQITRGYMYSYYQDFKHEGKVDIDHARALYKQSANTTYKDFKRHQAQIKNWFQTIAHEQS